MTSSDLEVQERASTSLQILKYVQKIRDKGEEIFEEEMKTFFAGELNPVGPKASDKHGECENFISKYNALTHTNQTRTGKMSVFWLVWFSIELLLV